MRKVLTPRPKISNPVLGLVLMLRYFFFTPVPECRKRFFLLIFSVFLKLIPCQNLFNETANFRRHFFDSCCRVDIDISPPAEPKEVIHAQASLKLIKNKTSIIAGAA